MSGTASTATAATAAPIPTSNDSGLSLNRPTVTQARPHAVAPTTVQRGPTTRAITTCSATTATSPSSAPATTAGSGAVSDEAAGAGTTLAKLATATQPR